MLANIFYAREQDFPKLMSFLAVDLVEEDKYSAFNTYSLELEKYVLPDKIDDFLTDDHVFLATAYNDLISILNVLGENLQYSYINVNLIFSALEEDLTIVKKFAKIVEQYTDEGTFGTVVIKNYVIISDGSGVLSTEQEKVVTKNLNWLQKYRAKSKIIDSIFILDDKNLNAVFLGYQHEYLSFALYEFIIAIMTNQYKLISNLPGKNQILSFGVGSVFFDKLYFNAFFDNVIYHQFLLNESISISSINRYNSESLNKVNSLFTTFYGDCTTDLSDVYDLVQLNTDESLQTNIGSYNILLEYLLGQREAHIVNVDELNVKYTIKELIFHVIYNYVLEDKKDVVTVTEAKAIYVRLHYNKQELKELKSLEDNYEDAIESLEDRIVLENETYQKFVKQVETTFIKYRKPLERKYLKLNQLQELDGKLRNLQRELELVKQEYAKKGFFGKLFSRRLHRHTVAGLNFDMDDVRGEIARFSKSVDQIKNSLDSLFALYNVCEENHNRIESVISSLHVQGKFYEDQWRSTPYIDYSFIQNIMNHSLLNDYFEAHKTELTHDIKLPLRRLIDKEVEIYEIVYDYKLKTVNNRIGIIDFNISDYMEGEYDHMKLFTKFEYKVDIKKLKERGRPFINMIPTYISQTHELFSIFNDKGKEKVLNQIKDYYSSAIPLTIDCPNKDRFLSINIESIVSVDMVTKSSKKEE
ncbi:hypothetical protein HX065_17690 [Myroides odoratimimus]|nr:hypothetical protein [Myroides odoratimimus]MDM1461840.1 hypothetical protein [Myroides odoratimimus]